MKLELRNIKHSAFASQETHCYEATLYLDGRKVATVGNDGHGGCDREYWLDRAAEAQVHAYFKSLPKIPTEYVIDGKPMELAPCLEIWCGEQVNDWLIQRDLTRRLGRQVIGLHEGKCWTFKAKPADLPRVREGIARKYPGIVFLNDLPKDEALVLFRKHSA
jgi:hypothetical protein